MRDIVFKVSQHDTNLNEGVAARRTVSGVGVVHVEWTVFVTRADGNRDAGNATRMGGQWSRDAVSGAGDGHWFQEVG